jgi:vesicle-fusing ATPase
MLNAREPKIVNGPEILNKYVGASEENVRKLFADAEKEVRLFVFRHYTTNVVVGRNSTKKREMRVDSTLSSSMNWTLSSNNVDLQTAVPESATASSISSFPKQAPSFLSFYFLYLTVRYQMDGVDQLNNILIIGMTNRLDMIDEALLRPGRLEVHMEISLPDEAGRYQILNIHTMKMRVNGVMDQNVDLQELAVNTKNFSGAEIGGLIKSATSFAFNRHVKVRSKLDVWKFDYCGS